MSLTYLSSAERRARAILDAYGSWPECWPDNERQTTLECIAHSAALQQYQSQIVDLDLRIQSAQASALPRQADVLALQQRILARLPASSGGRDSAGTRSIYKRIIDWFITPHFAVALTGIAVLTIVMLHQHMLSTAPSKPATSAYEAWAWYDITGQDLAVANTASSLTMTDFLGLEDNEDGG